MPLHIVLIGLIIIWSIPTIALLVSSFREERAISRDGWWNAILNPDEWTLDNYDEVLNTRGMEDAFINSLIITVPTTWSS